MSVLFKNQFGGEQEENSYQSRHQHATRKIGQKDKREKEESLLVFGYACNLYFDHEKAVYFDEGKHLIPLMGDESLMIDRFDGRLLLEDISPFISKASSSQDNVLQLSHEEQEIERLCEEERYKALENGSSDDEHEEEEMKRFKAAIASESGSYSAVGMIYDNQQYYPQYEYDSSQIHADTPYYPAYNEKQITETFTSMREEPLSVVPLLQQHQLRQQQIQQQQEQQQQQQQPQLLPQPQPLPQQEEEIEVFVPPEELNIPADIDVAQKAPMFEELSRQAPIFHMDILAY